MIKGSMKNVIVIKNTGSDLFEQAIFILRPGERARSEKHIIREARKIIEEKTDFSGRNSKLFGK